MNNFDMIEEEMTDANKTGPRVSKGGVFAPTDIKLIRDALLFYLNHCGDITDSEQRQTANLLHRLSNRI